MDHNDTVYWEYRARCNEAFRPFAPIDLPQFFKGRESHVSRLIDELRAPGRQVAIYGERGVGKTSLAKLAYFFASFDDQHTHFVRCDERSTYESIFGQILQLAGAGYVPSGIETKSSSGGRLGTLLAGLSGSRTTRAKQQPVISATNIGPALLLGKFQELDGLLILDEYDRVQDQPTHTRVAETLKHFSDAASKTKIIVVGAAETLSQLVGAHQSLLRCLAQIKLDRMSQDELGQIVKTGEDRVGIVFDDRVRRKIVALSDGFPFYTHLLCKYCAEEAGRVLIENPEARPVASEPEYRRSVYKAIEGAESTLRENYQAAVVTVKRKTEMFKYVLWAVAYANDIEVQVKQIAQNIGALTGEEPRVESLSAYLGPLTKPEKGQVLLRVRQGYYKFANPLMRAYIRLILEAYNIDTHGQRVFPWMQQG